MTKTVLLCMAAVMASPAQTFTTLVTFDWMNGADPTYMSLTQGLDGAYWGATTKGGSYGYGTVFKLAPARIDGCLLPFCFTTIHDFDQTDGSLPLGSLLLGLDGALYGTTEAGGTVAGPAEGGTVYRISSTNALSTIYSFSSGVGSNPNAGVIEIDGGNFYGTTLYHGGLGSGTAYQLTTGGVLTTLHRFDYLGGPPNGAFPSAPLMQAADGALYGTTVAGGTAPDGGDGEIFKIVLEGPDIGETVVASFDGTNGANPYAGLIQLPDGAFYGTASAGGANGKGTVFAVTPGGTLTTLHNFNTADGANPYGGLIQATDGNLYGTTLNGGASGYGTIFRITPGGALATLHSFDLTDGANPNGALLQATDGNFYGATSAGGANGDGTLFQLSMGLRPFVKTVPTSGKVGAAVTILGTHMLGPLSVTFDGIPAVIEGATLSAIFTSVPAGAATGEVAVTTADGTLLSNVVFTLIQ